MIECVDVFLLCLFCPTEWKAERFWSGTGGSVHELICIMFEHTDLNTKLDFAIFVDVRWTAEVESRDNWVYP